MASIMDLSLDWVLLRLASVSICVQFVDVLLICSFAALRNAPEASRYILEQGPRVVFISLTGIIKTSLSKFSCKLDRPDIEALRE